jgi:hypothetical protein
MTTDQIKSKIREVRDQLSIDYADGEYLNVASRNLGLERPKFGYTDDDWRALAKAIALQYKQVLPRFHAVMAILFGPQHTEVATIAQNIFVGDRSFYVNDASTLPQIGTIVIDESLATEETLDYCFIDYSTNQIFLASDVIFGFDHAALDQDAESAILFTDSIDTLALVNTADFPTSDYPHTLILHRTDTNLEEVVQLDDTDLSANSIVLAAPFVTSPEDIVVSSIKSQTTFVYMSQATFLTLAASRQFPEEGVVLLSTYTDEFTAIGGTTAYVDVAAGAFNANVHVGQWVRFTDDTTTGALQGVERSITANTGSRITFGSVLPASPVSGDTFVIMQAPFTATGGTISTVTVSAGTFTEDLQVGNVVVFDGNITAALAGEEANVLSNVDSKLVFSSTLSGTPVSGDTFRIRPRIRYTSNDPDSNELVLARAIFDMSLPEGVDVELLEEQATAALAQVQVKGTGWDVYQVTPRLVELFIPELLQDEGTLRSASYLHIEEIASTPSTTLAAGAAAGASTLDLTDFTTFPIVGVLLIDPGGVEERIGYYKSGVAAGGDITTIAGSLLVDGETFVLDDGTNPAVTFEFDDDDSVVQDLTLRKVAFTSGSSADDIRDAIIIAVNAAPILGITASEAESAKVSLINDTGGNDGNQTITETVVNAGFAVSGMAGGVDRVTLATQTLENTFSIGETVELYQPVYSSTNLLIGDSFTTVDTFPGPNLYSFSEESPTGTVAQTTLAETVPGPTKVVIDQVAGNSALEVKDATLFELTNFPYNIVIGRDTGNRETIAIADVNLQRRVNTTVATGVTGGTTNILEVAALSGGGAGDAADFPNTQGYRVIIDKDGSNEEVVYVVSTSTGPDSLILEANMLNNHSIGESVELLADVLTTNTALADFHEGWVPYSVRSLAATPPNSLLSRWPEFSSNDILTSERVEPLLDEFDVVSSSGLDAAGGTVILNFGDAEQSVEDTPTADINPAATVIDLTDSSIFPVFVPFEIILSPNTAIEERHLVTTNNTGTNKLTINDGSYGATYKHEIVKGATILWIPGSQEVVEYDSITGNTLSFSPAIVLQSNHSITEPVIDSSTQSVPRSDGFDYPLRLPPDIATRIQILFDLIRAAGVQVSIIDSR